MDFWRDMRYAGRMLLRSPVLTAVVVLSLALGSGANSAIYSIVDAVLLRPLPYSHPERLVTLWENDAANPAKTQPFSVADLFDFQAQSRRFRGIEGYHPWSYNLTGNGDPERVVGAVVTAGLFPLLGPAPILGRSFRPEEDQPQGDPVAMVSYDLWRRRFGADPGILGAKLILDNKPYTVIGVMPSGREFPRRADLWTLLRESRKGGDRGFQFLRAVGRLAPGVTLAAARAEARTIASRLEREYRDTNKDRGATVVPLREELVGASRPALVVLFGAVLLLLAVACANVASLLLARAEMRREEFAVRSAIGAGRGRLMRQLITESLLLALAGGALGLLFARWGVQLLIKLSPQRIYGLSDAVIDGRVLAFTLAVSLCAGLAFGLLPALAAARPDLNRGLRSASGRLAGDGSKVYGLLAAAEIAIACTLLIGAGLLLQSFARLRGVPPGFNPDRLLTLQVSLPEKKYPKLAQIDGFTSEVLGRVRSLPGVEAAAWTSTLPLANGMNVDVTFTIKGEPPLAPGKHQVSWLRVVSPDYFRFLGIRLLAGRSLTGRDDARAAGAAVINETMARRFFGARSPLDREVVLEPEDLGPLGQPSLAPLKVVGVVADVRHGGLTSEVLPEVYVPLPQNPWRLLNLVVRTNRDPGALSKPVSREVWAVDRNLPVFAVRTMDEILDGSVAQPRFATFLLSAFALAGLLLAALGVYGVLAYSVARRGREIGLRMALGALPGDVLRLVLGQALALAAGGIAVGLLAAMALSRLLASLVFGIATTDLATFAGVALLLGAVALVASCLPALRAARLDPMATLRTE